MELSRKERLILANQHRILELLDEGSADHHRETWQILVRGYELAYEWVADGLWEETPVSTCQEVINILELYRALTFSRERLGEVEDLDEADVEFRGFDGNEESEHYSFASFLVDTQGKWGELSDAGDGLNSHMPMLYRYREMFRVWDEEMGREPRLNEQQIQRIAEAGRNAAP